MFHVVDSDVRRTQCANAIGMIQIIHRMRLSSNRFYVFIMQWCLMVSGSKESVKAKNFVIL